MFKHLLVTLFFFSVGVPLSSQNFSYDSIKVEFNKQPADTTRLKAMMDFIETIRHNNASEDWFFLSNLLMKEAQIQNNEYWQKKANTELSTFYYHNGELDSAIWYSTQAMELIRRSGNQRELAVVSGNLGLIYSQTGNYDTSLHLIQQAIEIDSLRNDSARIGVNHNLKGLIYNYKSDFVLASRHFHRSLDIGSAIKDSIMIYRALTNLGIVYTHHEDYDDALHYFQRAYQIDLAVGNKRNIANDYNNLGMTFEYKDELDSALYYYNQAIELFTQLDDNYELASVYNNLGIVYEKKKDAEQAAYHYLTSLELKEAIGNPEKIISSLINLGSFYLEVGEYSKVEPILLRGYRMATETGNKEWIRKLSDYLYLYYKQIGDFQKALSYHEEFKTLQDTLFNTEKITIIQELKEKYEAAEKDKQIAQTNLTLEQQKTKTAKRTLLLSVFVSLFVIAFLLFAVFYFRNKNTQKEKGILQRNFYQLENSNLQLKEDIKQLKEKTISPDVILQKSITLTNKDKSVVTLKDIIYIEAAKNGVQIYTKQNRIWEWQNLKNMKAVLPSEIFLQVHRSYLVNIYHIKGKKAKTLAMSNGTSINIGNTVRKEVHEFLDTKMVKGSLN
ncbi:MAG: LytTR family transcriptional regulator [Bacteroidota bacterium]